VPLFNWLEPLVLDVRHGLRGVRRAPLFSAVAMLSLALGIGANTAIFSIISALMLEALPVRDPQALVQVSVGERQTFLTHPIWEAIRERQQVFAHQRRLLRDAGRFVGGRSDARSNRRPARRRRRRAGCRAQ
jgi:hypothetical protein